MDVLSNSNISKQFPRPYYLSRLNFETSHGKSKSDGLGGVVKSFVLRSVNSEGTAVINAMELINSALKISLFEIMMVLLIIVVSFLLKQETLKILESKLQNVHIK